MDISIAEVEYVAKLAMLEFNAQEKEAYTQNLSDILDHIQVLQQLDTTDVPVTTHVLDMENVFREDQVQPCLNREQALANAPDSQDGYFRVPKIL